MTILRYHGFNNWNVKKEPGEDLNKEFTFGFELEVTCSNVTSSSLTAEELATKLEETFPDLFVYEHDSSIGNGVEIISQPMTWKWFLNNQYIFIDLLNICLDSGFSSHNGNKCGLHVHIGRQALRGFDNDNDRITESKVITNMNFILERYQKEIFKFSRRTTSSYIQWASNRTELIDIDGHAFIDKDKIRVINQQNRTRYTALNLANNKTVEYRFLRGTLRYETFFISMNLIKNMVEQSRISNHSVTFKQLLELGLEDTMLDYLNEYCEKRNLNLNGQECNTVLFLENVKSTKRNDFFDRIALANAILDE